MRASLSTRPVKVGLHIRPHIHQTLFRLGVPWKALHRGNRIVKGHKGQFVVSLPRSCVPSQITPRTSPAVLDLYAGMQMIPVGYNDDVCIEMFG
jgi:hypothetical protein